MFITFEGGEGAGKTTLMQQVENQLKDRCSLLITREPGGTIFGEKARQLVLENRDDFILSPVAEMLLYLTSRAQNLHEKILPALKRGELVLCDRFSDSTIAYQGVGRELGYEYVTQCALLAVRNVQPDLTFYIDLDPEIGLNRLIERQKGKEELYDRIEKEKLDFHNRTREGYHMLYRDYPERIVLLDGTLSVEELTELSMKEIEKRL